MDVLIQFMGVTATAAGSIDHPTAGLDSRYEKPLQTACNNNLSNQGVDFPSTRKA